MPKGIYKHQPWPKERKRAHSLALIGHTVSMTTRKSLSGAMKKRPSPAGFTQKGVSWNAARRQQHSQRQLGKTRKKHTLKSRKLMSRIARAKRPVIFIDESKLARHRFEYKIWRQAVYARDNYTCLKCQPRGGHLHPHHIVNFANCKNFAMTRLMA